MSTSDVLDQLSTVIEPDIQRDIVSLGMVRNLNIDDASVTFTLAMPVYNSPHADSLVEQAKAAAQQVSGIESVSVEWIVDVPTNPEVHGRSDVPARHLIAVSSGKGGVGKSTVSANIATALAQAGAAVGLMDADILGPNLPTIMGVQRLPPPTPQKLVPAETHGLQLISMGFLVDRDKPLIWRGPMLHQAIRQLFVDVAWAELEYMIIDLPPGTGDAQLTLAQIVPLTGAVIVTQPQEVALSDARRGLAMFETVEVNVMGVVENMAGDLFGTGGGETFAAEKGVPFLGRVPLDAQIRVGGDSGQPVVVAAPESEAAEAFRQIAHRIAVQASAMALSEDDDAIPLTTIG
ncbi:MAG: Mrp/NBP35 family ATP-binding protein [Chloroflexi bacterium]|nr:Mrp/NBP35 family ATP-binding protein [Chloroflexota bacterium]